MVAEVHGSVPPPFVLWWLCGISFFAGLLLVGFVNFRRPSTVSAGVYRFAPRSFVGAPGSMANDFMYGMRSSRLQPPPSTLLLFCFGCVYSRSSLTRDVKETSKMCVHPLVKRVGAAPLQTFCDAYAGFFFFLVLFLVCVFILFF